MTPPEDFDPVPGQATLLAPGLRRILAPNPSPMTWRGTNTYLLGRRGIAVIDPGPEDDRHLAAILHALEPGQQITHILVTHAHLDHSPLARKLSAETGAPVLAYGDANAGRSQVMKDLAHQGLAGGGEGVDHAFCPDLTLADGALIEGDGWQVEAIWTPGHFGNHLCFLWGDVGFSGDLVMGWASSLVSPPDGDLTEFMASCKKLRGRDVSVLHAGHGAPIQPPQERIDWLITHRLSREADILTALSQGPADAATLTRQIYDETPSGLLPAAERNVFAHLVDLTQKNAIRPQGALAWDAIFEAQSAAK